MAACCNATRIDASISTTMFSSRERESDWISSSSWLRWIATSATRASSSATLAAVSIIPCWACLASRRASFDWPALSCWRRTSSCSTLATRCWARQAIHRLAARATSIALNTISARRRMSGGAAVGTAATGPEAMPDGPASGVGGVAFTLRSIVGRPPPPTGWARPRTPRRSRGCARAVRCAGGLQPRGTMSSRRPPPPLWRRAGCRSPASC